MNQTARLVAVKPAPALAMVTALATATTDAGQLASLHVYISNVENLIF